MYSPVSPPPLTATAYHLSSTDRLGDSEVIVRPAILVCGDGPCPLLGQAAKGIGGAGGLDDQDAAGTGYVEPEVVHLIDGQELARDGGSGALRR